MARGYNSGTVYIPGDETQIYVNKDGYIIFEILQKTQDENEIMNELTRRKIFVEKESLQKFLNQLIATFSFFDIQKKTNDVATARKGYLFSWTK